MFFTHVPNTKFMVYYQWYFFVTSIIIGTIIDNNQVAKCRKKIILKLNYFNKINK